MLLSEVARTGRRFRRKSEPDNWYTLRGKEILISQLVNGHINTVAVPVDAEQLCATDWEAEPRQIQICAQDLLDVAKNLSQHPITNQRRLAPAEFMKLVIEELGLHE